MKRKFTLLMIVVLLGGAYVNAQTETNVVALKQIENTKSQEWTVQKKRVDDYSRMNNMPIYLRNKTGQTMQMVDVIDGQPQYYMTYNLGAAHTTRANELWSDGNAGLNEEGEGYHQLGEWDGGKVRISHQEFTDQGVSRVSVMDGNHATSDHATHVAGTMVAAGVKAQAKGMAFKATLKTWEWSNDEGEMAAAAASGLEISNHSYGYNRGWYYQGGSWKWAGNNNVSQDEDYRFGFYNNDSRSLDNIAFNAPNYLIVWAAGNDRGEGPSDAGNGKAEKDGGADGFDCIGTQGIAKNILTVGAVKEVWNYDGPESVRMSSFSCWGPADDGRIKPDVVAKGVGVYSSTDISNSSYASFNGTSMASPNTSGTLALLQNYYQNSHASGPMKAATLKGLVIHTTDEAGPDEGPDYMFGWGLVNAERASSIITDDMGQNVIDELVLQNNDEYIRELTINEGSDLKVTICWTDRPGNPVSPQLDPINPMLVNDLDLRIEGPDGISYYPWRLDRDNPSGAAVRDDKNNVDNVEVVFIENPGAGIYTIHVDHDGFLSGSSQAYSIIISGIEEYAVAPECADQMIEPADGAVDVMLNQYISWRPADFATSYDVYFGTDGNGTSTPTSVYNGENFLTNGFDFLMKENTTYYLKVIPRNNQGTADGCDVIWSFTTMSAISIFPYLQDVEGVSSPDIPQYWSTYDFSEVEWFSTDMVSNSGSNSLACYFSGSLELYDMNNWLVSPPIRVVDGNEYLVSFNAMTIPSQPEQLSLYWGYSPSPDSLTNLMWERNDLVISSFEQFQSLFIPNEDSIVYFGWHYHSTPGYGIFIDDLMVEDWGTVGIDDHNTESDPQIYFSDNKVVIVSDEQWEGSEIKVINLLGQVVYQSTLAGNSSEFIEMTDFDSGLYLINLTNKTKGFTVKIVNQR